MGDRDTPRRSVIARCTELTERRAAALTLGRVLLPALLRDVTEQTRELQRVARDPARLATLDDDAWRRLEGETLDVSGDGWCLGVLSAAAGANLLRMRREGQGLRRLAERLTQVLGRHLEPGVETLPRVGRGHGEGWEVPFLFALLLLRAARAQAPTAPLRWDVGWAEERWHVTVDGAPAAEDWSALLSVLPGARPSGRCARGAGMSLPAACLAAN